MHSPASGPAAPAAAALPAFRLRAATGVRRPLWRLASLGVLALGSTVLFAMLVTANSAGYRYGVSDQAFYIPAVLRTISPTLFPHDALLLDSQSRLTLSDELIASFSRTVAGDLADVFLGGYLVTVALFACGIALVGSTLYRSWWTTAVLGLALTLRHRIAGTGVNTFEGYFHPRVLAFALGLLAVGSALRSRRWAAAALAAAALVVHPTTGLWFVIWIGVSLVASSCGARSLRPWAVGAAAAVAGGLWAIWRGPLAGALVAMDPAWTAALADKQYLFPTDWPAKVWLTNAVGPCVIAIVYWWRRAVGVVTPVERGLVAGAFVLLTFFASTLPFVAQRVALAIQLQASRVLWPIDFLATAYLVWAVADAPWGRRPSSSCLRARALVAILLAAGLLRGVYVLRVEHSRPLAVVDLPETSWQDAAAWAERHTPLDANFLVDPHHAVKYGTSFRVAARRDVFLESVKDAAMSTYSREVAVRVLARMRSLSDFGSLTTQGALALAAAHDLDYLVTDRRFALREVYANEQFRVYALKR